MKRFLCYVILILGAPALLAAVDSTRVVIPDSTLKADTLSQPPMPLPAVTPPDTFRSFAPLTSHVDSIVTMLFGAPGQARPKIDLPQMSSRFDYDPLLFRFSPSHWGEFETVFPLGMQPSALSCVDPLAGDESFANATPFPASGEFTRMTTADEYHLLAPALAGIGSPFGRTFVAYERLRLPDVDTALSKIYVTRGTAGFANTSFIFENHFGKAGVVNADGTFMKKSSDQSYSGSKLSRLRLVSRPALARNLSTTFSLFISRLNGTKLYKPFDSRYTGTLGDNYSGASAQATYCRSDFVNYRATLAYRNDDQRVDYESLHSHQRFQVFDAHLARQTQGSPLNVELSADLRYLRFTENWSTHDVLYYNLAGSGLRPLTDRVTAYTNISLRGSSDLKVKPSITILADYRLDSLRTLAAIISRGVFLPQPEMQYLRPVMGWLFDTVAADYRISGDDRLEAGYSNNIEMRFTNSWRHGITALARAGFADFHSLPQWQVDYDVYVNGDIRAVAADRKLLFASLTAQATLPHGIYGQAGYAYREVFQDNFNLTEGPQHVGSGIAGMRFPIHKLKIMANVGFGGRFRSATQGISGGDDDARFLLEAYFGFDLKSFHFFWNYTNLLNITYYVGGYRQPGRAIWWGFTWAFID